MAEEGRERRQVIRTIQEQAAQDKDKAYQDGLTDGARRATLTVPATDVKVIRYCSLKEYVLGSKKPVKP